MEEVKIAIISDSGAILDTLGRELTRLNYNVIIVVNNRKLPKKLTSENPHIIIIDINSMLKEGVLLLQSLSSNDNIRESWIFALTSEDKLKNYNIFPYVDDFLLAPVSIPELDARIKKALNSKRVIEFDKKLESDGLVIYSDRHEVYLDNKLLIFTYKEFELLHLLASRPGIPFSRETLLREIWDYDMYGETRTVDNHIRRIRSKLGYKYRNKIKTIPKVGYKFG